MAQKNLLILIHIIIHFIRHKYLINSSVVQFLGTLIFRLVLIVHVGFQGVSILSFF